jgi:hypothetical protein
LSLAVHCSLAVQSDSTSASTVSTSRLSVAQQHAGSDRPTADAFGFPQRARCGGVGLQHSKEYEMSPERSPNLSVHRNHHGAKWVAAISHCAVFIGAQWPSQRSAAASSVAVSSPLSQVAPFRAQLRSSLPASRSVSLRVVSSGAVSRSVAVRSDGAELLARVTSLRSSSLPNHALVPTAHPRTRLGSRAQSGAAAAQRGRYVSEKEVTT